MEKFKSYVLIETNVNLTKSIQKVLLELKGVVSVNSITGPYDLIVLVEGGDSQTVGNIILENIRTIPGVEGTLTCVVLG